MLVEHLQSSRLGLTLTRGRLSKMHTSPCIISHIVKGINCESRFLVFFVIYIQLRWLFTLLFIANTHTTCFCLIGHHQMYKLTLQAGSLTATAACSFQVGTVLQSCTCLIVALISYIEALRVVRV
jgi:hypothetical protein